MTTAWFTFGPDHVHVVRGVRWDANVVCEVVADDPRGVMLATFGTRWSFQYDSLADVQVERFYPRGVLRLQCGAELDRDPRTLAHTHGPDTSKAAARGDRTLNRTRVLRRFVGRELTSYQAFMLGCCGLDLTEVRRRCTDLKALGLLEPTGATLDLQPVRRGDVLRMTADGRAHLGIPDGSLF